MTCRYANDEFEHIFTTMLNKHGTKKNNKRVGATTNLKSI